ncbi:hypothetical protein LCGC14_2264620 [marine sediment metagenome]|uniref:Uncharacterized protein n=1 Tax=marine sediment metagenome TaxID=412755 RepID=A0A0F9FB39_9ZZZZ|nr:hypothetical protein [bacterium]
MSELEFLEKHPNMTGQDYRELQRVGQRCNYCGELQFLASEHEINCNLNPYFQNRLSQGWRPLNGIDEQ